MLLAFIFSDVGVGEWFVLLAVILIVVGPQRLPETARKVGRVLSRMRRMSDEFKRQVMAMDTEVDRRFDKVGEQVGEAFRVDGDEALANPEQARPEA